VTQARRRRSAAEIRWLSAASLRLHAALVVGLAGAAFATWFEWTRAHSGHPVAWVYTFEWPLLAAFGTYLWWRLLRADHRPPADRPAEPAGDAGAPDPELAAWQAYLDRLHAADPPGRAPHERA
jgi:hypothetical protein